VSNFSRTSICCEGTKTRSPLGFQQNLRVAADCSKKSGMMKVQDGTTKKSQQTGQNVPDRAKASGLMNGPDGITKKSGNPSPHAPDRAKKSGFMLEPSGPTMKRLQYQKRAANNAEEIENPLPDVGVCGFSRIASRHEGTTTRRSFV